MSARSNVARVLARAMFALALLVLAMPPGARADVNDPHMLVVRGLVKGTNGVPASGARVVARGTVNAETTTDDRGRYTLEVPLGSAASLKRAGFALEVRAEASNKRLALAGGAPALGLELALAPGGTRVRVRSNLQDATTALASAYAQDGMTTAWIEADFGAALAGKGVLELRVTDEVDATATRPRALPPVPTPTVASPARETARTAPAETTARRAPAATSATSATRPAPVAPGTPKPALPKRPKRAATRPAASATSAPMATPTPASAPAIATPPASASPTSAPALTAERATTPTSANARPPASASTPLTPAPANAAPRTSAPAPAIAPAPAPAIASPPASVATSTPPHAPAIASPPASAAPHPADPAPAVAIQVRTPDPAPAPAPAPPATRVVSDPRIKAIEPFSPPSAVILDTCACRVYGTVEIDWERPRERNFTVDLVLTGPAKQSCEVEMFMGSPREFRVGPLPCGDYKLTVRPHGRVRYALRRGGNTLDVHCAGFTQVPIVLVPKR